MPYPPDYGGVFDLFYKIKSLHTLGIRIHLHCFEFGRGRQPELEKYCSEIHYYPRGKYFWLHFLRIPFIVSSRKTKRLLHQLNENPAPVLLEGIHCTGYLATRQLISGNIWVRLHNVEYEYYRRLSMSSHSLLKKIYFKYEGLRLKRYERQLAKDARYLSVSTADSELYKEQFHPRDIRYLPVFLPFKKVNGQAGMGDYCLYHGNLSVPENEKAVELLLQQVFDNSLMPFVIAGKNPGKRLEKLVREHPSARLIANPAETELNELIQKAHIHVLPVFNATGIKIKLLNALYNGRFVITDDATIKETAISSLCIFANGAHQFREAIIAQSKIPFATADIELRRKVLTAEFDNEKNAIELIRLFETD